MVRQKAVKTKRERERSFQAWYDPENPHELPVIEAFDYLQQRTGWKPKQLIAEAICRLAQDEGLSSSSLLTNNSETAIDQRMARLLAAVDQLTAMISTGHFVPTSEAARNAAQDFSTAAGEMDGIGRSVARNYKALRFEDEDDGA